MDLKRQDFGPDFAWGVSSAAFQIEGATGQHGKGMSIWDHFTHRKGKVKSGDHADTTCDFYNRFPQDLALMHSMNIPNYRFSISWSRIFPYGTGAVNKAGVDYYNRLIDICLELEIEPWVTIYHWDLPLELEKKGGWANRDIIYWFESFVSYCVKSFGDRVRNWMVLNEPMVFTGAGYFLGIHAPGRRSPDAFFAAVHHAALCQATGGAILRSMRNDLNIGTTFSCSAIDPLTQSEADVAAGMRVDALLNRLFVEPMLGLGYPLKKLKILQRLEPFIKDGDEKKLVFDMDFIGVHNYTREIVTHSWMTPYLQARLVPAPQRNVETTLMNWEVFPGSISRMLYQFGSYPRVPRLQVTENGAAFEDILEDGAINDLKRKKYLQDYLSEVLQAKQNGINVNGYFVWTFTDNFEWAEGYHPRFGIVHVDFATQKRTIKSSGPWYKKFLCRQPCAASIFTKDPVISHR